MPLNTIIIMIINIKELQDMLDPTLKKPLSVIQLKLLNMLKLLTLLP
jgi:hypothetical protein